VTVAGAGGPRGAERSRTGIEMILIQPGTFTMGSPTSEEGRDKRGNNETQHQVTISRSYYLGKTEVTQGMWKNIMGDNPSHFSSCGEECPVEKASWKETVEFCNKLSDREGLTRCYSDSSSNATWNQGCTGYRLPTEAEWEYAARAGTSTRFACGDDKSCLKELGWYLSTPGVGPRGPNGGVFPQTHPVGEKTANAWGLYDMHGNVWEWVWDWKAEYPGGPVTDPAGPSAGSDRVIRGGGSADYDGRGCRSANRNGRGPGDHVQFVGFRLARSAR
jgi:formylglycine-generating enzyme required for sulfatase activity